MQLQCIKLNGTKNKTHNFKGLFLLSFIYEFVHTCFYVRLYLCMAVCEWICLWSPEVCISSLKNWNSYSIYSILKIYMEARTHLLLKSLLVQDVAFVYCGSVPVLAITGSLCLEIPYQTHLWCPVSSHAGRQLSLVLQSYSIGFCHSTDHPVSLTCSSSVSLLISLQYL